MSSHPTFLLPGDEYIPAYLRQGKEQVAQRAQQALAALEDCQLCPRRCRANRLLGPQGTCKTGRLAIVSSAFAHRGEEDCLRGWRGSGTIFFSRCNLLCVFCQNFDISHSAAGAAASAADLAGMMIHLQQQGCHNINFVTPDHVVPQILEALVLAIDQGLQLPLVYNSSGFSGEQALQLLDGIIDIYMPDFKIWDPAASQRYLRTRHYPKAARQALIEMHRQVGVLQLDEDGLALRGVLLRHLVMPGNAAGTAEIMRFVARQLSPDTFINLMGQYRPAGMVGAENFPLINRPVSASEMAAARAAALKSGLWRFD